VACTTVHVPDEHHAEGIVETAKARRCDLIVMGSHGRRGVGALLLGSVAAKVVALSAIPVLIRR
jgi:nucleotide-binding universal stress UspA family protein